MDVILQSLIASPLYKNCRLSGIHHILHRTVRFNSLSHKVGMFLYYTIKNHLSLAEADQHTGKRIFHYNKSEKLKGKVVKNY